MDQARTFSDPPDSEIAKWDDEARGRESEVGGLFAADQVARGCRPGGKWWHAGRWAQAFSVKIRVHLIFAHAGAIERVQLYDLGKFSYDGGSQREDRIGTYTARLGYLDHSHTAAVSALHLDVELFMPHDQYDIYLRSKSQHIGHGRNSIISLRNASTHALISDCLCSLGDILAANDAGVSTMMPDARPANDKST